MHEPPPKKNKLQKIGEYVYPLVAFISCLHDHVVDVSPHVVAHFHPYLGAFVAMPMGNIATLAIVGVLFKHKEVQMAIVFHLLQFGSPMTKYHAMKEPLQFLGVPKVKT